MKERVVEFNVVRLTLLFFVVQFIYILSAHCLGLSTPPPPTIDKAE